MSKPRQSQKAFKAYLKKVYALYTLGFIGFVLLLAFFERAGLQRDVMGYIFLAATVFLYAGIGILSRTNDADEYYVAGRRVPAVFNGMATGADWMSAASFISMAGILYLQGYSGLALIIGWTAGYVLVALFLAPYLRKFGQYTIPDFLGARYGGHIPRMIGIVIVILCSFIYVVAQIYGVGLITTRLTGLEFSVGIFLGLAGILVCSFLGGMKAVTWTQVAQYIILIIAYFIPAIWLSVQQTGNPIAQFSYGAQLKKVSELEVKLIDDPKEKKLRADFKKRAEAAEEYLRDVPKSYLEQKAALTKNIEQAKVNKNPDLESAAAEALRNFPKDAASAKLFWTKEAALLARSKPPIRHAEAFPGQDAEEQDKKRRNFLALVFCLTVGTAALPHILMRYYTTPSVKEARNSVTWSLFFILLLYVTAPALAVMVKFTIYNDIVGTSFSSLPAWVKQWSRVDASLLSIIDFNRDGIVQLAEIMIGADVVVLALPEIAGLPYVVSGLVAAGGLAAALSTADGLLLTIANALSHDFYYKMIAPDAPTSRRVLISKCLLLIVAATATAVANLKIADIVFLVSAAFSIAASGFFPILVMGIFWKRTTGIAACAGMLSGVGLTLYYMISNQLWLREKFLGTARSIKQDLWFDIEPISAGVFGVPLGFFVIFVISFITPTPSRETQDLVDNLRYPNLKPA